MVYVRGVTQGIRKLVKKSNNVNVLNNVQSGFKGMTLGQKLNAGGIVVAGAMGYSDARAEGASVPGALAKGATDAFLIDLVGWKTYIGGSLAINAPGYGVRKYNEWEMRARELSRTGYSAPFSNSTFVDNEQIYTMRQAGMAMMDQSKQNVKQAILGNEAQAMHK